MNTHIYDIPLVNMLYVLVPAVLVLFILRAWHMEVRKSILAITRMLLQLAMVGFVLTFIFESDQAAIVLMVLSVMLVAASWISLTHIKERAYPLFFSAFIAIVVGGGFTLLTVTYGVLDVDPWYAPRQMIPLAGMIFANAMTSISLSVERLIADLEKHQPLQKAQASAFNAALIPTVNALLAVGLVSLPGMMTGQILSGVAPLVAVKYQIMVMLMIFSSTVIASAIFLRMSQSYFSNAASGEISNMN